MKQNRNVSGNPDLDPAKAVAQPVAKALDSLIMGAAVSFALTVVAVLAAVLTPDGPLHEVAHFALLGVMAVIVAMRAVHILRRREPPDPDAWTRAKRHHPSDARMAQLLTVTVPLAWLVGGATILVHHQSLLHHAMLVFAALLPIAAALWILASFAWHDFCHDHVAAALDESDRRYREYWKDIARTS